MSAPAILPTERCNWCSKWRPHHRLHHLPSNQNLCDYCLEWHIEALDMLGGATPRGCQACRRTWDELRAMTPEIRVRMYAVPKDGIYQLLCRDCVKPYMPKRADLYRGTQCGEDLKL